MRRAATLDVDVAEPAEPAVELTALKRPGSVESAYDSFMERVPMSEADALTDALAASADPEATMRAQLARLLAPGTMVSLAESQGEPQAGRPGKVVAAADADGRCRVALEAVTLAATGESLTAQEVLMSLSELRPQSFVPTASQMKLIRACAAGETGAVASLLQAGADANSVDQAGQGGLFWACRNRHEPCAALLLAAGAEPSLANIDGCTPLHILCEKVDPDDELPDDAGGRLVECLLSYCGGEGDGGDGDDGVEQRKLVELLLNAGASVPGPRGAHGMTAVDICRACGAELAGLLRYMLTFDKEGEDDVDQWVSELESINDIEDVVTRLMTQMCMQREAENERLGRKEDDDEVCRQVVMSPHFKAALHARGEMRGDFEKFTSAYFQGNSTSHT